MTAEEFSDQFPELFHMAESGSWSSVRHHGLLSTSALLSLFAYEGECRALMEAAHRPASIEIFHEIHGKAVIRDQKPIKDRQLASCLTDGLTPGEWYRMLNERVFFWPTQERLSRLLNARAYRDKSHDVLCVDGRLFAERYADRIELCSINSGATFMKPAKRGRGTFVPLIDFLPGERVVEVAVKGGVPDIEALTKRVIRMQRDTVLATIWDPLSSA